MTQAGVSPGTRSDGGARRQTVQSGRARGIAAGIEAYFAASWFAWGMAVKDPWLPTPLLQTGLALSALVAVLGIVLALRSAPESTPMRDRAVRRRYAIVVGLEFAFIGAGAAVLTISGLQEWTPVMICAGVGLHFLPLARALREQSLAVLGVLLTAVAVAALVAGLASAVTPSTITGVGAGGCLVVSAAVTLIDRRFYTDR